MNTKLKNTSLTRMIVAGCFAFVGMLFLSGGASAQTVTYNNGVLGIGFNDGQLEAVINQHLNAKVAGYAVNSKSKTVYVKNFKSNFDRGSIRVLFDYNAKTRGWTNGPFGRIYGPWAKDSGWIEVRIFLGVKNNKLYAYTRNGYVKWGSNNWFTNTFLKSNLSQTVRDSSSNAVNQAIASMLGGRSLNVKQLLIDRGASTVARNSSMSYSEAKAAISTAIQSARIDANVQSHGLQIALNLAQPRAVIQIINTSKSNINFSVRFKPNESWVNYTIPPGSTKHIWHTQPIAVNIKFDGSFSPGSQMKNYRLIPMWTRRIGRLLSQDGTKYKFSVRGNEVFLTK